VDVVELSLGGLLLIKPRVFADARGSFFETFHEARYRAAGVRATFVQDNHSRSVRNTLRGLHYRAPGQAKLVEVVAGRTYDVAVDLRPESPTFGRWYGTVLDAMEPAQLFLPDGFAHGFCVLSDEAIVAYKVSTLYDATAEREIRWNDPDLAVSWPVSEPLVSARDEGAESFADYARRVGRR